MLHPVNVAPMFDSDICAAYVVLTLRHFRDSPGRVAQSVGHLTRKSGVLGSIPGLATYFLLLLLFQEGQLSVPGESMCTKYTPPSHEMAEGNIEFTLSVCVCVCLWVAEWCPGYNVAVHDGI